MSFLSYVSALAYALPIAGCIKCPNAFAGGETKGAGEPRAGDGASGGGYQTRPQTSRPALRGASVHQLVKCQSRVIVSQEREASSARPRPWLCAVQVHRHHPPLVWGRMHSADPEQNTGIAVCETNASLSSRNLYTVITYECASPPPGYSPACLLACTGLANAFVGTRIDAVVESASEIRVG